MPTRTSPPPAPGGAARSPSHAAHAAAVLVVDDIRVRSVQGQGSVFQVFLLTDPVPASDADAA